MLHKKLYIFVAFLIAALCGLLALLIHWGNQAINLREDLFVDRVSSEVDELVVELENSYYCFDLRTEASLPKLDSFYFDRFPGISLPEGERLQLKYTPSGGQERSFTKMPLMGPAHVQVLLRFEFDDIPEIKDDSSLTPFERYVRESYDQYATDEAGLRLIDTTNIDSLLNARVRKHYPEAILHYRIVKKSNNFLVYEYDQSGSNALFSPDIRASMYDSDPVLPALELEVQVMNKKAMLSGQTWNIYASAGALALIAVFLVFYLVRLQIQQKKLLRLQKDFVHGMTHEFNTPITNIKLLARKLLASDDESVRRSGHIMKEESEKLQNGINLVLTTALIEKDELMLQKNPLELREMLQKLVDRNSGLLKNHGIQFNLSFKEGDLATTGDAFHLESVFQNMINNVVRHSEANLLNIEAERNNGHILVHFNDNGKGIPREDRESIFKKFEGRGDKTKKGYGLGLYYSKMILQMHGGDIDVDGDSVGGAAFHIQLPA